MISYKIMRFLWVLYVLVESCSYDVFCLILYGHFSDLGSFSVCSRKVLVGPRNSCIYSHDWSILMLEGHLLPPPPLPNV